MVQNASLAHATLIPLKTKLSCQVFGHDSIRGREKAVLSQKVIRSRMLETRWEHHLAMQLPLISVNSFVSADVFLLPDFTQKHNFGSCLSRSHHKQRLCQELLTVPSTKANQIPQIITHHQKFRLRAAQIWNRWTYKQAGTRISYASGFNVKLQSFNTIWRYL